MDPQISATAQSIRAKLARKSSGAGDRNRLDVKRAKPTHTNAQVSGTAISTSLNPRSTSLPQRAASACPSTKDPKGLQYTHASSHQAYAPFYLGDYDDEEAEAISAALMEDAATKEKFKAADRSPATTDFHLPERLEPELRSNHPSLPATDPPASSLADGLGKPIRTASHFLPSALQTRRPPRSQASSDDRPERPSAAKFLPPALHKLEHRPRVSTAPSDAAERDAPNLFAAYLRTSAPKSTIATHTAYDGRATSSAASPATAHAGTATETRAAPAGAGACSCGNGAAQSAFSHSAHDASPRTDLPPPAAAANIQGGSAVRTSCYSMSERSDRVGVCPTDNCDLGDGAASVPARAADNVATTKPRGLGDARQADPDAPIWETLKVGDNCLAKRAGGWSLARVVGVTHGGYSNARFRVRLARADDGAAPVTWEVAARRLLRFHTAEGTLNPHQPSSLYVLCCILVHSRHQFVLQPGIVDAIRRCLLRSAQFRRPSRQLISKGSRCAHSTAVTAAANAELDARSAMQSQKLLLLSCSRITIHNGICEA